MQGFFIYGWIDARVPRKIMGGLYEKLKKDVFKGQTFKVRTLNDKGERLVKEVKSDQGEK